VGLINIILKLCALFSVLHRISSFVFLIFPTVVAAVTLVLLTNVYRGFPQFIQENYLDYAVKKDKARILPTSVP